MKIFIFFLSFHFLVYAKENKISENPYFQLKVFAESLNLIEKHYPEKKRRDQLIPGAIRGMLFELDPYSHFMNPKQAHSFEKQHKSFSGGIGIEVAFQNKQAMITSVYKNSPAEKKGLKAGDIITHVNNESIKNLSFDSATQKMRGKIGDTIILTIWRKKSPLHFSIQLDQFQIPSIEGKIIEDQFFYIQISSFRESTFREMKKILQVKKCRKIPQNPFCLILKNGLIIDLRGNSGGLIDQALLTADLFISKGKLASIKGKNTNQIFNAKPIGSINDIPIIILIDQYSASASEILTSALKDNNRALVAGRKSFGKGSIQSIFELEDGSNLKLTVSHYYTPKGNRIEKRGVLPDIVLNPENKLDIKKYSALIRNYKKQFQSFLNSTNNISSYKKKHFNTKKSNAIDDDDLQQILSILNHFHSK